MPRPIWPIATFSLKPELSNSVGILGGTFDPIHNAHLQLSLEARVVAGLGEVRLIPAGSPPHRQAPRATPNDRLAMVRLAIKGHAALSVDAGEVQSSQPSYTVPTLRRLRIELGMERPLILILGADAFAGLESWHAWRELFSLAHLLVGTRPNHALDADRMPAGLAAELKARQCAPEALSSVPAGHIASFAMTPMDISATAIRQRLASGGAVRGLLPDSVLDYISHHNLYQDPH